MNFVYYVLSNGQSVPAIPIREDNNGTTLLVICDDPKYNPNAGGTYVVHNVQKRKHDDEKNVWFGSTRIESQPESKSK